MTERKQSHDGDPEFRRHQGVQRGFEAAMDAIKEYCVGDFEEEECVLLRNMLAQRLMHANERHYVNLVLRKRMRKHSGDGGGKKAV